MLFLESNGSRRRTLKLEGLGSGAHLIQIERIRSMALDGGCDHVRRHLNQ
jgi:hypothetical protein